MDRAAPLDARTLADAVLVVAHPDDELLWFGSILRDVGRVIIAFRDYAAVPGLGRRRAAAMAALPYRDLACLGIPEAGSLRLADWSNPTPTEFGLALDGAAKGAEVAPHYARNFATIRAALADTLTRHATVFTHNPWGEYGHEDHVQLFRVVDSLRRQIGFDLWTSTYCSKRSAPLAARYAATATTRLVRRQIDADFTQGIADIYKAHGCWTWQADWPGFDEDCLLSMPLDDSTGAADGAPIPLHFVEFDG